MIAGRVALGQICLRLTLFVSPSLLVLLSPACQNKPAFEKTDQVAAAEQAAAREDWWNNQIDQKSIGADDIKKDVAVKAISDKLMADPLVGCGYALTDTPDQVDITPVNLVNGKSKITSGYVTVMGSGSLSITGKQSNMQISSAFKVLSTSPNNASGRATDLAEKGSGMTTFKNISQAQVQAALAAPANKPICGVSMANGLRSVSADGSTYVQATFDKPIVTMINPKLSVERIKLQLINPIKINGVTATMESNDEEVIAAGLVKKGDIQVSLIPTSRTITDSLGQVINITSDVAFRIANKFQGEGSDPSPTLLDQVADYYISKNKITHMVILSPLPELPVVVYKLTP